MKQSFYKFQESYSDVAVYSDHNYQSMPNDNDKSAPSSFMKKALDSLNHPVLQLPAKRNDLEKYSVVTNKDVQFVHVFVEQNASYVNCMSGVCQRGYGKKRKLETLDKHKNLCPHLKVFKEYWHERSKIYFFISFIIFFYLFIWWHCGIYFLRIISFLFWINS